MKTHSVKLCRDIFQPDLDFTLSGQHGEFSKCRRLVGLFWRLGCANIKFNIIACLCMIHEEINSKIECYHYENS